MAKTTIEWTENSWNPVTGCTKISPGCDNCYAEKMAKRLKAMGNPSYRNGFEVTLQEQLLDYPLKRKKPSIFFVNSMSDLFHKDIPFEYILRVFVTMNLAKQHIFQVLTKRTERLVKLSKKLPWSKNIWMGVSIENDDYKFRLDHLKNTDAKVKFISFEPLIGRVENPNLDGIDWAIVGGESGYKSRPIKTEWIDEIQVACHRSNTDFFFKQWGGFNKKKNGRLLHGKTWDEMPSLTRHLSTNP